MDGDSGEWQRGLTALRQYVACRGTAAVPPRAVAVGVAIGAWAEARRQNYWAGDLHPSCVPLSNPSPAGVGQAEARASLAHPLRRSDATRQRGGRPTPYRRMGHRAATGARRRQPTQAPHRATRRSARLAVDRGPLTARSHCSEGLPGPARDTGGRRRRRDPRLRPRTLGQALPGRLPQRLTQRLADRRPGIPTRLDLART